MNKKKQILKTKLKSYVEPNYSNNLKVCVHPLGIWQNINEMEEKNSKPSSD